MGEYLARIIEDAANWQNQTVRLLVAQRRHDGSDYLMENGTWKRVPDGQIADGAGVLLPRGAVEAVTAALDAWQGNTSHGATGAKVLREWLDVERSRVDRALRRALVEPEPEGPEQ